MSDHADVAAKYVPRDYINEPQRADVVAWLTARGFIRDGELLVIAWSNRLGYDFTDLEFYPLARHANDTGWDVIVGHHASGTNPRMVIGTCENLADVQMVYDTIRRINGWKGPEDERESQAPPPRPDRCQDPGA